MDDPGRMGLHHWAGFDSSHLKDCLKDHPAMKLMDMVAERDAAFAERDTAKAEKKTAFAERDAALLQRDVAYADRNAAWMERDAALTALSMVRAGKDNNEAAAKLMQMVNLGGAPVPIMDSNLQGVPKAQVKEATSKKQKSTAATGQNNKESKPPSKRSRKQKASVDAVNDVEKLREDGGLNKVSDALVTFFPSITPIPYCSCTGTNQQCYRWGKGGWQSACCTNFLSMYPLPMNPSKRSSRVPGRKMSGGAFRKLLERLLSEGVDISASVDLKTFWAKHGTNRYVTIK